VGSTNMAPPSRIFSFTPFTSNNLLYHMFPHITRKSPRGSSCGIQGVRVDVPGRAASVSAFILSVAQSFATCSRNSLYLIFDVGFIF